jgi:GNAT superfamily N-acetyltransferase
VTPETGSPVVVVRRARGADAAALEEMLDRCSAETRYRRFHGAGSWLPAAYLRRCLSGEPPAQEVRVVESVDRAASEASGRPCLVGLASACPVLDTPHVREVSALVEDRWQRRGIGRLLLGELCACLSAAGVRVVRLELCRSQPGLLAHVLGHAPVTAARAAGCDVSVDLDIRTGLSLGAPHPARPVARPAAARVR